ncbi:pyridoxine 5'-phosphate oxidase C-terminal domain-containing protein, partial [Clavibacter michiganensis]|uniref:pyridoxine 5'-phosphate oxidase C-terminal domain-containing protein n=1 Tax=Clavibacter michiganensis TaxID=28447 RepID=UPI002931B8FD
GQFSPDIWLVLNDPLVWGLLLRGLVVVLQSAAARADVDPGDWVLWRIRPVHVEFWQGSPDRRHARILFDRVGETWTRRGAAGERATPPA